MQTNGEKPPQQTNQSVTLEELRSQLDAAKGKREQSAAGLEDRFYEQQHTLLPDEIAALRFSDNPAEQKKYHQAVSEAKANFEKTELEPHDLEIAALQESYENAAQKQTDEERKAAVEKARQDFIAQNPDVSFDAINEFWSLDMTGREQKQIADATSNGDILAFYTNVKNFMLQKNQSNTQQPPQKEDNSKKLPPDFGGNTVAAKNLDGASNEDWAKQIGLGR